MTFGNSVDNKSGMDECVWKSKAEYSLRDQLQIGFCTCLSTKLVLWSSGSLPLNEAHIIVPLQNYSCNLVVNRELIGTVYSYGSQECSVCRNDQTVVKKEWAKTSVTPLQELFGPFTIIKKNCPTDQSSNNKHQEICLAATWRTVLETNKSWKKKDFATQIII